MSNVPDKTKLQHEPVKVVQSLWPQNWPSMLIIECVISDEVTTPLIWPEDS